MTIKQEKLINNAFRNVKGINISYNIGTNLITYDNENLLLKAIKKFISKKNKRKDLMMFSFIGDGNKFNDRLKLIDKVNK